MLTKHIALVSETAELGLDELQQVSAAISLQVTRDFSRLWNVNATVDPFSDSSKIPPGYWNVTAIPSDSPGDAGFHSSSDNQPRAFVHYAADWSVRASHEILEMLADPFGNSKQAGPVPDGSGKIVEYLIEVCDPCETITYDINGIAVADFCTPRFYDSVAAAGLQYSFTGAIQMPLQVLAGGYLSWQDPITKIFWQLQYFEDQPRIVQLDDADAALSLREFVDKATRKMRAAAVALKVARSKARTRSGDSKQKKKRS